MDLTENAKGVSKILLEVCHTNGILTHVMSVCLCSKDTAAEHELIRQAALANGATAAVVSTHWSDGGAGAKALAAALIEACDTPTQPSQFRHLYELERPIEEKIETIAREMYGAGSVELSDKARDAMRLYTEKVSVCVCIFRVCLIINE